MLSGIDLLSRYKRLNLVFPISVPYPYEIKMGFKNFCQQTSFDYTILNEIDDSTQIRKQEAYIVIEETDLVQVIKKSRALQMKLGQEIGLLSFNETPLKRDFVGRYHRYFHGP